MMKHFLARPYEIIEILTELNQMQRQQMLKLRIGSTGKTGSYSTLNIMTQTTDGIAGQRSREEAAQAMRNNGAIDIPNPKYGYLGRSQITHDRLNQCLYNDWIQRDIGEIIYVYRLGGNSSAREFMCQIGVCACRHHVKYTRGVIGK